MISLRASMLPAYTDCPRRAAAKQFRRDIEAAGYTLRTTQKSVGAAVGTALHAAFAELCRQRRDDPEFAYTAQTGKLATELAVAQFDIEAADGIEYDDTTKRGQAPTAIEKMIAAILPVVYRLIPHHIEEEMKARLDHAELTGHLDVSEITGTIWDVKTGAREPSPQAQLGAYRLLAKACELMPADQGGDVGMIYIKRVRASKDQPEPVIRIFDSGECELAAWATIQSAIAQKQEFDDSGESWAFPANPMSQMCSLVYCPAHSTPFCKVGKQTTQED